MTWRNGVAFPRTDGQQVLVGVVQHPWKLSHETQVSTPRMYGTYLVPYLLAIYREQDYQEVFLLSIWGPWKPPQLRAVSTDKSGD